MNTARGVVEERFEVPTDARRPPAAVLGDCVALASDLAEGHGGLPIGMGVCELFVYSCTSLSWFPASSYV